MEQEEFIEIFTEPVEFDDDAFHDLELEDGYYHYRRSSSARGFEEKLANWFYVKEGYIWSVADYEIAVEDNEEYDSGNKEWFVIDPRGLTIQAHEIGEFFLDTMGNGNENLLALTKVCDTHEEMIEYIRNHYEMLFEDKKEDKYRKGNMLQHKLNPEHIVILKEDILWNYELDNNQINYQRELENQDEFEEEDILLAQEGWDGIERNTEEYLPFCLYHADELGYSQYAPRTTTNSDRYGSPLVVEEGYGRNQTYRPHDEECEDIYEEHDNIYFSTTEFCSRIFATIPEEPLFLKCMNLTDNSAEFTINAVLISEKQMKSYAENRNPTLLIRYT